MVRRTPSARVLELFDAGGRAVSSPAQTAGTLEDSVTPKKSCAIAGSLHNRQYRPNIPARIEAFPVRIYRHAAVTALASRVSALVMVAALPSACVANAASVEEDAVATHEALTAFPAKPADTDTRKFCDVVVAGGTTAAVAAAIAAADYGARTCLLEPTEWVGGQLTASGVSAVDWAWHKVGTLDVGDLAKDRANVTPNFFSMMTAVGNPGACWVSKNCYEPKNLLTGALGALVGRYVSGGSLLILKQTVVKRLVMANGNIERIVAVQREAKAGVTWGGYDTLPSQDVPDWYEPSDSARYHKKVVELSSGYDRAAVFIDATEWGELLALSGAAYVQGVETSEGSLDADDTCGQSTVFPLVEKLNASATSEPTLPAAVPESRSFYSIDNGLGRTIAEKWDAIWRYRRVKGGAASATTGDLSEQNWNPGNDYPFGYLLKTRTATAAERANWHGGIDFGVMAAAERHAYGWHTFFKAKAGALASRVTLDRGVLGTGHGLAKLPYVRDTRRSVGLGGFVLATRDMTGSASQRTGTRFDDRVALGAYEIDIHPLRSCRYPAYVYQHGSSLPYYIPFRALTNRDVPNMLVAGKTMAQSFLANSATRLHPVEWSSGTAAGAAAAHMARWGISTQGAMDNIRDIQSVVRARTPIEWTIP